MDLQYGRVPMGGSHYESVYCTLADAEGRRAIWIRTTVGKRAGEAPTGALWVTSFADGGVRAGKADGQPVGSDGHGLQVGNAHHGTGGTTGSLTSSTFAATWDITFSPRSAPLDHLRPAVLYRSPIPRTKSTSPIPSLVAGGHIELDGTSIDLTGWTGMLGHNWGREHAAQWIWLRVARLGDDEGWLDAVMGRVRTGPMLTPWTAFGAMQLDGVRHRLGGLGRRSTRVQITDDGAEVRLGSGQLTVTVRARTEPASCVGWEYRDPSGLRHEVVNSSVASMTVDIDDGVSQRRLDPSGGVVEIGGDHRPWSVDLQPHGD